NIGETPSTPSLFRAAAWNESRISISDKPVADLKVTLQRGVNVSGSIQFKGSAAVPKLEYAVGVVLTQAKVAWRMPLAMAFIDPRGQFSMASVVPGHYVLEMSGTSALAGWSLASA